MLWVSSIGISPSPSEVAGRDERESAPPPRLNRNPGQTSVRSLPPFYRMSSMHDCPWSEVLSDFHALTAAPASMVRVEGMSRFS